MIPCGAWRGIEAQRHNDPVEATPPVLLLRPCTHPDFVHEVGIVHSWVQLSPVVLLKL